MKKARDIPFDSEALLKNLAKLLTDRSAVTFHAGASHNDHKEWYVAENWWKAVITIENMLFLREFDTLEWRRFL